MGETYVTIARDGARQGGGPVTGGYQSSYTHKESYKPIHAHPHFLFSYTLSKLGFLSSKCVGLHGLS